MRGLLIVLGAGLLLGGCKKGDTPKDVCEKLIELRDATDKKYEKPRHARVQLCTDKMTVVREKMGEQEWKTFVPCAHASESEKAYVACSPTMAAAAEDARKRLGDTEARKEAMKAAIEKKMAEKQDAKAEAKAP